MNTETEVLRVIKCNHISNSQMDVHVLMNCCRQCADGTKNDVDSLTVIHLWQLYLLFRGGELLTHRTDVAGVLNPHKSQLPNSYPAAVADFPGGGGVQGGQPAPHQSIQIFYRVDPLQEVGPATRKSKKERLRLISLNTNSQRAPGRLEMWLQARRVCVPSSDRWIKTSSEYWLPYFLVDLVQA